ncbi:hypothetical protein [Sphingobacterium allocomposti]|uniref:hypothetical protein n=1 Tax=Sphingobacterium allocomposti TaxID=415956 RepID=UPI0011E8969D|nr:hypothetical protein [Sphingobacterium composti Yoo et al. 2007 non Ten et al. 2007]
MGLFKKPDVVVIESLNGGDCQRRLRSNQSNGVKVQVVTSLYVGIEALFEVATFLDSFFMI